jgi:hypothetical protein
MTYPLSIQTYGLSVMTLWTFSRAIAPALGWTKLGFVRTRADLRRLFEEIRDEIELTSSEQHLHGLYRQAKYLLTLPSSFIWKLRLGDEARNLKEMAELEFGATLERLRERTRILGLAIDRRS